MIAGIKNTFKSHLTWQGFIWFRMSSVQRVTKVMLTERVDVTTGSLQE